MMAAKEKPQRSRDSQIDSINWTLDTLENLGPIVTHSTLNYIEGVEGTGDAEDLDTPLRTGTQQCNSESEGIRHRYAKPTTTANIASSLDMSNGDRIYAFWLRWLTPLVPCVLFSLALLTHNAVPLKR